MDTTTILLFTFAFFGPMAVITIVYALTDRTGGYLGDPAQGRPLIPVHPVEHKDARVDATAPDTAAANDEQAREAA